MKIPSLPPPPQWLVATLSDSQAKHLLDVWRYPYYTSNSIALDCWNSTMGSPYPLPTPETICWKDLNGQARGARRKKLGSGKTQVTQLRGGGKLDCTHY